MGRQHWDGIGPLFTVLSILVNWDVNPVPVGIFAKSYQECAQELQSTRCRCSILMMGDLLQRSIHAGP